MEISQHLAIAEMLRIANTANELIDLYDLNFPELNLANLSKWEKLLSNSIIPSKNTKNVLTRLMKEYINLYKAVDK